MFLGLTEWTWGHVLSVPAILIATAMLPVATLVFLLGLSLAVQPAWFRYIIHNWKLMNRSLYKTIWYRIWHGVSYEISDMTDDVRSSYKKKWWGGNDPDDSDLKL